MRFVEETGGSWTAEQLKQAEAEIELQKKEWEANRLAAIRKEEEDDLKRQEEDNDIITYSSEDAKNQVNNKSKKPLNKRLAIVKNSYKNQNKKVTTTLGKRKMQQQQMQKSNIRNAAVNNNRTKKRQVVVVSKRIKRDHIKTKRTLRKTKASIDNSKLKCKARKVTRGSFNNLTLPLDDTIKSDDDVSIKESTALVHNSDFDSECSLDVMVDSNDAHNSDSNHSNRTNDETENDEDEDGEEDDENEENESTNDDTDGSETRIKTTGRKRRRKRLSSNHLDVNSPRTRSRGTVQINLWTLDVSPILPGVKPVKSANSSKNKSKSDDENIDEQDPLAITSEDLKHNDSDVEDEKPLINHQHNKKVIKTPVILDGFSNNTPPGHSPITKRKYTKKVNNGNNQSSLDGWLKQPKIVLSKIKVPDTDHIVASDYANSSRITRRASVFKSSPENGPS